MHTRQTNEDVIRADAEFRFNWQRRLAERALDAALEDSFPASDPPSWTAGIARLARTGDAARSTGSAR